MKKREIGHSMSRYIVIELQTNADGTVGNLVTSHDSRDAAESKYHTVLAAAAVSALPCHAATLLTSEGFMLDTKCYKHGEDATDSEVA